MMQQHRQPELMDEWGVRFHDRAETTTGGFWWYEQNGKRFPLRPVNYVAQQEGEAAAA